MSSLARDVAVVGVGYSPISREGAPDPRLLTLGAVNSALDDAGLAGSDIEGIFEYKFGPESPGAQDVARLIGVPDLVAFADLFASNPSGLGGTLASVMAVASGACETAMSFRCLTRASGHTGGVREGAHEAGGKDQFLLPYGLGGGIIMNVAMAKQRWMAQYGRGEEDFGRIAVNARQWSSKNERAALRDIITIDDYMESRTISDPLRLLDCDYPVNGAVAAIVTTAARARDLRKQPVLIDAMSYGTGAEVDWNFAADYLYGGTRTSSKRMWERSSFGPGDVDVAEIYDGFTTVTVQWIESLGFCGFGEYGDWIGDGSRIGPGGDLPMNTSGGQLAEGRLHGVSFLTEAVMQLRGECGERQVPDARVAVVASGLYIQAGSMVLHLG